MKKTILNYKEFIREFVDIHNMAPIEKIMHATKNALPQEYVEDAKAMDAEKEIVEEEQARKKEEAKSEDNNESDVVEPTKKQVG